MGIRTEHACYKMVNDIAGFLVIWREGGLLCEAEEERSVLFLRHELF